jgi:hypothetical protein
MSNSLAVVAGLIGKSPMAGMSFYNLDYIVGCKSLLMMSTMLSARTGRTSARLSLATSRRKIRLDRFSLNSESACRPKTARSDGGRP